jgi:hypothetical protein
LKKRKKLKRNKEIERKKERHFGRFLFSFESSAFAVACCNVLTQYLLTYVDVRTNFSVWKLSTNLQKSFRKKWKKIQAGNDLIMELKI